jgi:hypothetical protein
MSVSMTKVVNAVEVYSQVLQDTGKERRLDDSSVYHLLHSKLPKSDKDEYQNWHQRRNNPDNVDLIAVPTPQDCKSLIVWMKVKLNMMRQANQQKRREEATRTITSGAQRKAKSSAFTSLSANLRASALPTLEESSE